jgi:hypothetical protein
MRFDDARRDVSAEFLRLGLTSDVAFLLEIFLSGNVSTRVTLFKHIESGGPALWWTLAILLGTDEPHYPCDYDSEDDKPKDEAKAHTPTIHHPVMHDIGSIALLPVGEVVGPSEHKSRDEADDR